MLTKRIRQQAFWFEAIYLRIVVITGFLWFRAFYPRIKAMIGIRSRKQDEPVLTSQMNRILGTRDNFGSVLPVMFLAASGLVARCQGVPKNGNLGR